MRAGLTDVWRTRYRALARPSSNGDVRTRPMLFRKKVFRGFALLLATTVMFSYNFHPRVNERSSGETKNSTRSSHKREGRGEPPTIVLKEMKENRIKDNQASRRKRVREMCKQFNVIEDIAYTVHRRHYYFFDYNATVCAVPKVRPKRHCGE